MSLIDLERMASEVRLVAEIAGDAAMRFYGTGEHATKHDGSPVTLADDAAERVILSGLRRIAPAIPVVSEERHSDGIRHDLSGDRFWLVDPLDGTREFLAGNGEFTVNIALVADGTPILGVVVAPALDETYCAHGPGTGRLFKAGSSRSLSVRPPPAAGLTVVGSRSHGDADSLRAFLADTVVAEIRPAGSSLKLCLVASGQADLYPRLGPTMEWDIAAGHAVVLAAGGRVETLDGGTLRYGKPDHRNPHFVARA